MMGGVSAAVAKTAAAPIERIKLLVQNQDEMIKQGRLSHPYKGEQRDLASQNTALIRVTPRRYRRLLQPHLQGRGSRLPVAW